MQSANLGILARELLGCEIPDRAEEIRDILKAAGWKGTGAARLVAALWKKAVGGDVNAAKLIREMNGETGEYAAGGGLSGCGISGLMTAGGGYGSDGSCNGSAGAGAIGFNVAEMSDEALRAILDSACTDIDEDMECGTVGRTDLSGRAPETDDSEFSLGTAAAGMAGATAKRMTGADSEMDEKKKKSTYVVPW